MNTNTDTQTIAQFVPANQWFQWDDTGRSHNECVIVQTVVETPWADTLAIVSKCACGFLIKGLVKK